MTDNVGHLASHLEGGIDRLCFTGFADYRTRKASVTGNKKDRGTLKKTVQNWDRCGIGHVSPEAVLGNGERRRSTRNVDDGLPGHDRIGVLAQTSIRYIMYSLSSTEMGDRPWI